MSTILVGRNGIEGVVCLHFIMEKIDSLLIALNNLINTNAPIVLERSR